ncbi:immunoglobulin domain-containing protein [Horticoccus luteus]|uniref:Immunoglobulin domain-containing protein n=1 Tax=Horticoccus luteus TaxID=2862869 RepID=A0A8F9TUH5_9BACT|nr:immunoglobulin domain-containing protein [Horticoccus luteus]QYM77807.1 immunoglobulin domain-containing protein [Horticoccus luteus]
MSNFFRSLVSLPLLGAATALSAATVTTPILHDTFAAPAANAGLDVDANGFRAPTATQAVWYAGGAALVYNQNASVGASAGNRGLMAYFTPSTTVASLAVGETLTATVKFNYSGGSGASSTGDFRLAFLNSGGNGRAVNDGASANPRPDGELPPAARVIADNFSLTSGGNTPRGYSAYIVDSTASPTPSTNSLAFWRRDGAPGRSQQWLGPTSSDLATNSAFSQLLPGAGGGTVGAIANDGTSYVAQFSVRRVADKQMALSYSVTSGSTTVMTYAVTETSDTPLVGFDTFMILSTYNASLAVTDFLISRTSISPTITTDPASQTAPAGTAVNFSVVATGAPTPSYQWKKDGVAIDAATDATLALTNVQPADSGSYTVVVSNSAGSVTSAAATLMVLTAPVITTQPPDHTIFEGQTASFTVGVQGAPPLVYVWSKDGTPVSDGGVYSGATTATLTITGAQLTDAGTFTVTITNSYGSVTSAAATLGVFPATPPAIDTQPTGQTVFEGATVVLAATVSGPPPFVFQWYKDGVALADDSRTSGSATATLTLNSVRLDETGSYTLTVANFAAQVTSSAAQVTVNAAPRPAAPVAELARNINENGFTARWDSVANATGYRLDVATDAGFGSFVAGFQDLDVGPVLSDDVGGLAINTNYYYRVRAYNSSGTSGSSNTILVRVQPPVAPQITSGASTTFTEGVPGTFTFTATGAPPPTFTASGLPAWATLNPQTGVLSGTPPAGTIGAGLSSTTFTLNVTAQNDKSPNGTQIFTLVVQAVPSAGEPLTVTTLAGTAGSVGTTDATGAAARLNHPAAIAVDGGGTAYVADTGNHTIRKITAAGVVTTLAGKAGVAGSADGAGTAATFDAPSGIAVDAAGNVYVADTLNHIIRKVTAAGAVTTIAGSPGQAGSADGTNAAARFSWPQGLALDATGANLFIADTNNHAVRKIVLASGTVSTLAGFSGQPGSVDGVGGAARFDAPYGVAVDANGNVYVADTDNATIRLVTPDGAVTTLAGLAGSTGAADGTGAGARFNHPYGVTVDSAFNVYVVDTDNYTVRKIVSALGVVTTVGGQAGKPGSVDGIGTAARFNSPGGIAVNSAGDLYIADTDNNTVRSAGVPHGPVIVTHPQSLSVASGASAQFTVKATGRPAPTYQWYLNGNVVPNATSDTYTVSAASAANAGDYTVVVTNSLGSVTSNSAGLVVTATSAPPVSLPGGGGGAPGWWFYFALVVAAAARWLSRRRERRFSFMRHSTLFIFAAVLVLAGSAATLRAQVTTALVHDTWQDGTRTDPSATDGYAENNGVKGTDADSDGDLESQWFQGGVGTLTVSSGAMTATEDTASQTLFTYFTPAATPVTLAKAGDSMTLKWVFRTTGVNATNSSQGFNLAVAQAPADSRVTADGSIPSAAYTGYAMFMNMGASLGNSNSFQLRKWALGAGVAGNLLGTSGNWTALANGAPKNVHGYDDGTDYTFTITFTRIAGTPNTLDIVATMSGGTFNDTGSASVSYSDPSPSTFTFDTFDVRPSSAALTATTIDFRLFDVTYTTTVVAPSITTEPSPGSQSVAAGATVTYTVAATGDAPLGYKWAKGGVDLVDEAGHIAGATTDTLTISNAVSGDTGNYTVAVSNAGGTASSDSVALTVTSPPAAPVATAATGPSTAGFTANWSAGAGATSYRLDVSTDEFFGSFVSGYANRDVGNVLTQAITGLSDNTTYYYRVRAVNTDGTSASSNTINVATPPAPVSITTQPASQSVTIGSNVTFTVAATSSTSLSYQWLKRVGAGAFVEIGNATSASLVLTNVQLSDSNSAYEVVVTNAAGSVTSDPATLTVTAGAVAVTIATQPASQAVNAGGTVTFTVAASGTGPFTYVWKKDTNVVSDSAGHIAGSSTNTLTITNAVAGDAGVYTVDVSNAAPSTVTSADATLTVQSPPTASAATLVTESHFTANWSAVGGATTYQLDVATDSGFTAFVSGFQNLDVGNVTSSAVTGLAATSTYFYRVRAVNGSLATAASNTVSATTLAAPAGVTVVHDAVTAAAVNAGLATDANGFLTPTATQAPWVSFGTANIAYKPGTSLGTSSGSTRGLMAYFAPSAAPISLGLGETLSANVTFVFGASTPAENPGNFRLALLNSGGNGAATNDAAATISARYAPATSNSLTGTPTGNTARGYSGYIIDTKAATTASTDTLSFWTRTGTSVAASGSTQIIGPTSTDLAATGTFGLLGSGGGTAGAILNDATTVYTATFNITYVSASEIDLSYTVKSGGTTVMTYSYSQTSGPVVASFDSLMFYSSYGPAPSILDLHVTKLAAPPVFTTQPATQSATVGATVTLSAAATGSAPLSYRWQKNNVDLNDGGIISGATTDTLTLAGVQLADSGDYKLVVTNAAASVASTVATLTVSSAPVAPTITAQPQSATLAAGTSASFSVAVTGSTPITYQWKKDGVALSDNARITGSATATLAVANLQNGDAGSYTVDVTNSVTTVTSDAAVLTVTAPPPAIVVQPLTQSALLGSRVSLSVFATGVGPLSYQWKKSGSDIAGATASTLTLTGLDSSDGGNYTVGVTNGGGTTTSATAVLTTVAPASATLPTQPIIPAGVFNVVDYGAVGDGTTNNTASIQAAINAAQAAGGGTIEIPAAASPYLTGPLTLRSNMNLQIDGGAILRALPYGTYPNSTTSPADLISIASGATNIAITGNGVIEGDGAAWWTAYNNDSTISRPRLLQFTRAANVLVSGITLQNSPQFHLAMSGSGGTSNSNVTIFGLTVTAPSSSPNTDGVDPTATNVLIQNCTISVGDDNIAIKAANGPCSNITVADCTFGTGHGLSVGGQTNLGLDGLTVLRCTFNGTTSGLRLKADATQGGVVQNLTYSDITMTNVQYPIVFYSYYNQVGNPGATSGSNQTTPTKVKAWNVTPPNPLAAATVSVWKNIAINNLTATGASGYSIIWGLPLANGLISNVSLNNVSIAGGPGLELYNVADVQYSGTTSFTGLTTANALAITGQPAAQAIAPGQTATFTVVAAGTSGVNGTAPTYQWRREGIALVDGAQSNGSVVSGAQSATLTITGARNGNAGAYTCTVANTLDGYNTASSVLAPDSLPVSSTSKGAQLSVSTSGTLPTINTPPVSQTVATGSTVTLTVEASSATPLSYHWTKDGNALGDGGRVSGTGTATLTLTGVQPADSADYAVVVTNDGGSVTSASATLAVQTPPLITSQSVSQAAFQGDNVTLSVVATGTAPLSYQWKKDGVNLADGGALSGTGTASLTLTGVVVADSGSYTVKVSNAVGAATSTPAVLTVTIPPMAPPAPVAQPATNLASGGFTAHWNAVDNAQGYLLDVSTDSSFATFLNGYNGFDVGTNLSRNIAGLSAGTSYYYRVRAYNDVGPSANSTVIEAATPTLSQAPVITSASSTTFTIGLPASFTITASGAPASTFAAAGLPDWVTLNSATGVLAGTPPNGTVGAIYHLVLTAHNGSGADATQVFTLSVQDVPAPAVPMTITTVAGQVLTAGSADGTGTGATFRDPMAVAVDATGNIYVADTDNHVIRRIAPGGVVTTFAGTAGSPGTANGSGATARFNSPAGITVDSSGNVYVADTLNHTIRRISVSGSVSTLAGLAGTSGSADGTAAARFFGPQGVAFYSDGANSSLYVADTNNHTIRKVNLATTEVTTVAGLAGQPGAVDGTGSAARFNAPSDVAVDRNGNLYVADTENNTIRAVSAGGVVKTIAGLAGSSGAADGTATAARFNHPSALTVDGSFNVFVLDTDNHTIRKIVSVGGVVTTVAGQAGTFGSADGVGAAARFKFPSGIVQAPSGEFYIADTVNQTVRQGVFPNAPIIQTQPQSQSVTAGATVQFFVAATGQPAPTYRWYFNGNQVSSGTSTTLTVTNVQASNAGQYTVVVSNSQGTVTSNAATLTVNNPPSSGGVGGSSDSGGGGGGAPGAWFYLALSLLAAARWLQSRGARRLSSIKNS